MKFGQLIRRIIIKIVATKCQILRLKCTKIDFSWGSAPDPAGGAYSAPPDPLAGLKGLTSKGRGEDMAREGKGRQGEEGEGKRGRKGKWREREGNGRPPNMRPGSAYVTGWPKKLHTCKFSLLYLPR